MQSLARLTGGPAADKEPHLFGCELCKLNDLDASRAQPALERHMHERRAAESKCKSRRTWNAERVPVCVYVANGGL